MTHHIPYTINKKEMARNFSKASLTYDAAAILQNEIGQRLLDRLDSIEEIPAVHSILDLGSGTGHFTQKLHSKFKQAQVINLDLSYKLLERSQAKNAKYLQCQHVCADGESLPFSDNSFDFVFSNCVFHWCFEIPKLLHEIKRILKPKGMLLFSLFGQDTLKELRSAFFNIDSLPHVNPFPDMHHIGDALIRSGFSEPVVDLEMLTMTYGNLNDLLKDIKHLGGNTIQRSPNQGLTTPKMFNQLINAYETYRIDKHLPATFEVIYGYARF